MAAAVLNPLYADVLIHTTRRGMGKAWKNELKQFNHIYLFTHMFQFI